jgi:hypothetical protein
MAKLDILPLDIREIDYDVPEVVALRALSNGTADADQQKRILNWFLFKLCVTFEANYQQDSRDHAFLSGRQFVGTALNAVLQTDPRLLEQATTGAPQNVRKTKHKTTRQRARK